MLHLKRWKLRCHNLHVNDLNFTLQKWYHCLRDIPGRSKDTLYELIMTLTGGNKVVPRTNRCF